MSTTGIHITDRAPASDRDRRERLGVSVDDLAAKAGISPEELVAYEQASSEEDAVLSIAFKVGDALDELERGEPESHPT